MFPMFFLASSYTRRPEATLGAVSVFQAASFRPPASSSGPPANYPSWLLPLRRNSPGKLTPTVFLPHFRRDQQPSVRPQQLLPPTISFSEQPSASSVAAEKKAPAGSFVSSGSADSGEVAAIASTIFPVSLPHQPCSMLRSPGDRFVWLGSSCRGC